MAEQDSPILNVARVAGTLPAEGPEPPAAVVFCFPGVAPQPATALAASTARTPAATARE